MKIAIGCDHAGFKVKQAIISYLCENGYEYQDFGTYDESSCDYPDLAQKMCAAINDKEIDTGILICGSGIGISIAANRCKGIRAAILYNDEVAHLAREHNDANVAGLAEAILGAGKGKPSCFYVTISTGIGGAFVVDGKLVSGGRGHAGEIGNIIVKNNGYKHGALNAGAAEGEASGTAVTRKGKELIGEEVQHAGHVFELASQGNEVAQQLVDEFIDNISTMFANISHVVDPHCIVIGGGVMKAKEHFWDRLVEAFNSKVHVGMQGHIKFTTAEIEDCGAIGAVMLPMSQLG